MSGKHVYEFGRKERVLHFVDTLIDAGRKPGFSDVKWAPFVRRSDVVTELESRGFELCEDGANHDPRLRRFFAAPKRKPE